MSTTIDRVTFQALELEWSRAVGDLRVMRRPEGDHMVLTRFVSRDYIETVAAQMAVMAARVPGSWVQILVLEKDVIVTLSVTSEPDPVPVQVDGWDEITAPIEIKESTS